MFQEQLWAGCRSVHREPGQGNVRQQLPEGGNYLGQHLQHLLCRGSLRRLQGVWHWSRARTVRSGQLHGGQNRHHGNPQKEQLNCLVLCDYKN